MSLPQLPPEEVASAGRADGAEYLPAGSPSANVWTIPKRLRVYFRFDRRLFGQLARAAWETIVEVYRTVLGSDELLPGAIAGIQTFGELAHYHPHLHVIATDGAYTPDGTFVCITSLQKLFLRRTFPRAIER